MSAFLDRLRTALGRAGQPFVLLGNFEVERHWGEGELGLPTFNSPGSDLVVNRMDEFALTLAGPDDVVVLKSQPDAGYLEYLTSLGLTLPRILTPAVSNPANDVTGDALADESLRLLLSRLRDSGAAILPHGISEREERLAETTGVPLAGPSAAVAKAVNGKVYSRRLTEELGLRQPAGRWCDSIDRWREAVTWARDVLAAGGRVAVKDSFGVSGKGILVIADAGRLNQLDRMFTSRATRRGTEALGVVVEEWVEKSADLNYQFTLGRDGAVRVDFVKEALTESGVHKGHLVPARLGTGVREEIEECCRRVGAALATEGFFGVVGVDAMLDPDGRLYPVTEINARNNMSTYQETLLELLELTGRTALARHYPVVVPGGVPFAGLRDALGDLLLTDKNASGMVVNNFATVTAAESGRLYGILLGSGLDAVRDLDDRLTGVLDEWQKETVA
ncbi:ATP-grasp domain-containing protein [Actinoplanes sp. TBRC 11911]|uniref:preATP grasp domain-containing protein n=1 Tax=Actinoplanes sp. TBRC 11911 TaxID=2729386 RepID=UPI00145ED73C|nr:ATP-grasp domain-containing protein [Actinoplanes sp. TBRC 11911]NMO53358.1 ATP-grasp domain-containing protein [Actinoplanes sp. TBRC 11911]